MRQERITYDQQAELTELRKNGRFATIAVDIRREPLRRVERAFQVVPEGTRWHGSGGVLRGSPALQNVPGVN